MTRLLDRLAAWWLRRRGCPMSADPVKLNDSSDIYEVCGRFHYLTMCSTFLQYERGNHAWMVDAHDGAKHYTRLIKERAQ